MSRIESNLGENVSIRENEEKKLEKTHKIKRITRMVVEDLLRAKKSVNIGGGIFCGKNQGVFDR